MGTMKRALGLLVIGCLPLFASCILDAQKDTGGSGGDTGEFLPLDKRDNVIFNLKLAYNQRNFLEFRKLLDNSQDAYIFFFSPADVAGGIVTNSQWGIGEELEVTERLFDRNPPAGDPRADAINLDLIYTKGEDTWQPFVSSQFPNETWYEKPVEYVLKVKVGETDYSQNKTVVAMFTVRQKPGETTWHIVRWKDDIGG